MVIRLISLSLGILLGLVTLLNPWTTPVASATPAHCSPNAIQTSTHYANYDHLDDSYISFAYDIDDQVTALDGDPLCYSPTSGQTIAISLIANENLYTNFGQRITGPSDASSTYDHQIYGVNWGATALVATTTSDTVFFYADFRLLRVGRPGVIEILLYATKEGAGTDRYEPLDDGNILGRGIFNGDILPIAFPSSTYSPLVRIYWNSGVILASGSSNYALVIRASLGDASNRVEWRTSTAPSDTGGNNYGSETADSGVTWSAMNSAAVYPWMITSGADLIAIDSNKVLASYQWNDEPTSGIGAGSVYFPLALNTGDYVEITDYSLMIWDTATTQPDAIYRLGESCLVVLEGPSSTFYLTSVADFIGSNADQSLVNNIPILNLLMGDVSSEGSRGSNLTYSLGIGVVPAFLIITIAFSFALMLITARFTTHYMIILLAGMIPPVVMTMQGLLPVLVLTATGSFVILTLLWQALVKRNV